MLSILQHKRYTSIAGMYSTLCNSHPRSCHVEADAQVTHIWDIELKTDPNAVFCNSYPMSQRMEPDDLQDIIIAFIESKNE